MIIEVKMRVIRCDHPECFSVEEFEGDVSDEEILEDSEFVETVDGKTFCPVHKGEVSKN